MNVDTGEIKMGSEVEVKKLAEDGNWKPLDWKRGDVIEIRGLGKACRFEIMSISIKPGKPGRMSLKLKGVGK